MAENPAAAPEAPRRSTGRIIARNTVFGLGAQIALKVITLLFNILVVRTLGGEAFGQYSVILGWASLFSVLGDLGITQYLQREIARDPSRTQELFWDTAVLRVLLAVFCSAVTVGSAILFANDFSTFMLAGLFVFTLGYFFQALIVPMNNVISGNERVDITSVFAVIQQINFTVLATIALLLNWGFLGLLAVSTINLPITLGLHWWAIRRHKLGPPRFRLTPQLWWMLVKLGLPFGLQQLSLSFAFRLDVVLLNQFGVSNLHIGWYTIAYTNLTLTFLNLAMSFNMAIMPTLAREYAQNIEVGRNWYFRTVKSLLFLGLPIAVGGTVLALEILAFLYPEELPAAIPLMILVWDIPIVLYHSYCGITSTSIRREGAGARIYFAAGVMNLVINLILIPRFGIIGSAFATVVTDMFAALQFYFLYRKDFGPDLNFVRLSRIGIAAALMGLVVYMLRDWHILLVILIGAVFYAVVTWASGAFTPEEKEEFRSIAKRVMGRVKVRRAV